MYILCKHYPFLLIDSTYKSRMIHSIFQDFGVPLLHILISISTGAYVFCDPWTFHVLLSTKYKMQKQIISKHLWNNIEEYGKVQYCIFQVWEVLTSLTIICFHFFFHNDYLLSLWRQYLVCNIWWHGACNHHLSLKCWDYKYVPLCPSKQIFSIESYKQ